MGLLTDIVRQKIEAGHQEEARKKDELRNGLWGIAYGHDQPEEVRTNAQQQLEKLYGPEQKKGLQKFGQIFQKLTGMSGNGQPDVKAGDSVLAQPPQNGTRALSAPPQSSSAAAPSDPDTATIGLQPGGGAMVTQPPPSPQSDAIAPSKHGPLAAPAFSLPPAATDAQMRAPIDAEKQRRYDSAVAGGWSKQDATEFKETGKFPTNHKRISDKGVARPGEDPETGKPFTGTWDHTIDVDGTEAWAKRDDKPVNTQLAWFKYPDDKEGDAPHAVRVDPRNPDKRIDASTGKPAPDGANQVNTGILETKIRQQTFGQFGNLFRSLKGQGYSDQEAALLAGQQVEEERQKRVSLLGAGSIHEAMGEDASGNPVAISLHSQKTPNAVAQLPPPASSGSTPPPATGSSTTPPAIAPPQSPVSSPSGAAPSAPSSLPASPSQKPVLGPPAAKNPAAPGVPPSPSGSSGGIRQLEAFTPAQGRAFREKLAPIRSGLTQIFGDPTQPDIKGITKYVDLADNQSSREKLGKAFRLTFDGLSGATQHGNVAVGAGPVHVSAGGIGEWLQNALGVPPAVAGQQAKIMQDAISSLTPREQEYYDAVMTSFGTMVGLRSLTKASAALGSVAAIERELPVIGVNTTNSRQFADQSQRLAEEVYNGLQGISPKALQQAAPGLIEHLKSVPGEMQKLKDSTPSPKGSIGSPGGLPKPPKPGAEISTDDAMAYLKAAGGNRAKAEKNAKDDGWKF